MINIEYAMRTEKGSVRETNQDRIFADITSINGVTCGVFCIADGMGGLSDGHLAATYAVDKVENWWNERFQMLIHENILDKRREMSNELLTLFTEANDCILRCSQEKNKRYGTTCSLLLICGDRYFIAHTGDSRIYLAKKKWLGKEGIKQLTIDHTWLTDQVKLGNLSFDEIHTNPNRNKLTGGLGISQHPRVFTCSDTLSGFGVFIICSDGLYRVINDRELARTAIKLKHSDNLVNKLVDTALSRNTTDNTSLIAVIFNNKQKDNSVNRIVLSGTNEQTEAETLE